MPASLTLTATLRAAVLSLDRYAGAAVAEDRLWTARQAAALLEYERQAGAAMLEVAGRLDDLLIASHTEGLGYSAIDEQGARTYSERLSSQGFSTDEVKAGLAIGLSE